MKDGYSKGEKLRAAQRATKLALAIETACAENAKATGGEVPGISVEGFQRIYLDELGRHPVPNRAMRRAKR